jgi:hypothetical protein
MRIAVAEAWEQFRNPGEGKCPPLEAVARGLVVTNPNTISSLSYILQYIQNVFKSSLFLNHVLSNVFCALANESRCS